MTTSTHGRETVTSPARGDDRSFTAIIPIKQLHMAKSRLGLAQAHRQTAAEAFALDTIAAATAAQHVGRILLVVGDSETERCLAQAGIRILRESPIATPGLNSALRQAALWVDRHHPDDPTVVLTADLPTVTPEALDATLGALRHYERAYVPDRSGTGTTVLSASRPAQLRPRFGVGSAQAHRRTGAVRLAGVDPRMRLDVDTLPDLASAAHLGLGYHTLTVWNAAPELYSAATAGAPPDDAMETSHA